MTGPGESWHGTLGDLPHRGEGEGGQVGPGPGNHQVGRGHGVRLPPEDEVPDNIQDLHPVAAGGGGDGDQPGVDVDNDGHQGLALSSTKITFKISV